MASLVNPFNDSLALEHSHYSAFVHERLVNPATGERRAPLTRFVHDSVRSLILNDQFPCVGAKSALRQGAYRFGLYETLGSPASAAGLARDLVTFISDLDAMQSPFSTYLASFAGPVPADEVAFEGLLWQTLQQVHDLDAVHHAWDASVSSDPSDAGFSFSVGGVAFFVVGLHGASSRATRRFAWPTIVLNPHQQFDRLKADGTFARFQEVIRQADRDLQGSVNPMLSEHGMQSEAMQYAGRQVEPDWHCPFHTHATVLPTSVRKD